MAVKRSPVSRRPRAVALAVVLIVCLLFPKQALADAITLGSASTYGILVGSGDKFAVGGGLTLTGDLGLSQNATLAISKTNNSVSGNVYQDSNLSVTGSGSINVAGDIFTQSMAQAISDASSASTSAGSLAGTAGLVSQGGAISVNGGSITIKALTNLSENVLNISALSLTNGTLTFDDNGYTGAKFIINVTGAFSINSSGSKTSAIRGINGASATDILFNIEGTGSTVSLTGNSGNSVLGTILAPQRNVTLSGGGSLTGALIAGVKNAGKTYTLTEASSGYNITEFGYKPQAGAGTGGGGAPEPSSLLLYGGGVSLLAWVRRYKFKAQPGEAPYHSVRKGMVSSFSHLRRRQNLSHTRGKYAAIRAAN